MMSRRTTVLRLCQRLTSLRGPSNEVPLRFAPACRVDIPAPTNAISFNTCSRIYDSTRFVSGDFDSSRYMEEDDFEKDDFDFENEFENKGDFNSKSRDSYDQKPSRWVGNRHSRDDQPSSRWSNQRSSPRWSDDRSTPRWSNDRSTLRWSNDQESRDNGSNASYLRGQYQERQGNRGSMEDLWNKLNENEVDFGNEGPVEKNFYAEHPDVTNRPQEEIKKFMDAHQMTVVGKNSKKPIFNFEETGFPEKIVSMLKTKFDQPTPIQSIGWPHALSGCNTVGIAQTGSGKTLSFILPAILHIQAQKKQAKGDGPVALVMCPTRELAMQCHEVVRPFSRLCGIKSVVIYGGQSKLIQAEKLSKPGLDIVIATPGRLLDFLTTDAVSLRRCSFLVLDEADRMLDMGFEPQIRAVMGQIRPDRQVLMWSATWPEEIQELASDFLKDYVHLKIGAQTHTVNADITQQFHYCASHEKIDLLIEHLRENRDPDNPRRPAKTLIFSDTKSQCSRIQGILRRERIYCDTLHGDKSQRQRDDVMYNFRNGRTRVVVASDVAARGLDVADIEFVINFDLPKNIDSYIHRVGRTGRAGKKGTAISFITVEDLEMIRPLIDVLEDVDHEVPDLFQQLLAKRQKLKAYRRSESRNERRSRNFRY